MAFQPNDPSGVSSHKRGSIARCSQLRRWVAVSWLVAGPPWIDGHPVQRIEPAPERSAVGRRDCDSPRRFNPFRQALATECCAVHVHSANSLLADTTQVGLQPPRPPRMSSLFCPPPNLRGQSVCLPLFFGVCVFIVRCRGYKLGLSACTQARPEPRLNGFSDPLWAVERWRVEACSNIGELIVFSCVVTASTCDGGSASHPLLRCLCFSGRLWRGWGGKRVCACTWYY